MINPQNGSSKFTFEEKFILAGKAQEIPYTGKYNEFWGEGIYVCKRCRKALYRSENKFEAGTGLPSFDKEISGAIKLVPDPDGVRTEIVCAHCGAHLGHLFTGEKLTPNNTRHCVSSIALDFVPDLMPR